MVYQTWADELKAFEEACDELRKAKKGSLPINVLGAGNLVGLLALPSLGWGRRMVALAGMATAGVATLLEADKNRNVYGGSLVIDINPHSDFDNLASAFRTRSPRWECLAFLYSQLDPQHIKGRLQHFSEDEAGKILDRMVRRIRKGLDEIKSLPNTKSDYHELVGLIAAEWKEDVVKILDRALFKKGLIDREDVEDLDDLEEEAIASEPYSEAGQSSSEPSPMTSAEGISPPPVSVNWTGQQWQLWQRLIKDCPELRFALMAKLVVVSGPQQTGKSSLASAIAYLRSYLLGWPTIAVTPHRDGKKIFDGEVIGAGGDFDAIQSFYTDMVENFEMGGDRQSLVIDELTQYSNGHEELGQSIVRTALSESDKHGIAPILINHAKTVSAGFSGIKGMRELIDSSATQLTRQYGETAWGEQTRSPEVKLTRPGKGEATLTIPDWLHLPTLQQQFSNPLTHNQRSSEDSEPMAAWVDSDDDSDEDSGLNYPMPKLLTGWTASHQALRLYGWMVRKQQATGQVRFTINDLAIGRPLGKKKSHAVEVLQPLIGELLQGGMVKADADRSISLNL